MVPWRITIHCSDSPDSRDVKTSEIKLWHTRKPPDGRGYIDIAYHYCIERSGLICEGRKIDVVGAHVLGSNQGNVGICLVGRSKYTAEQWRSLVTLVSVLKDEYKIPLDKVFCHNEFHSAVKQGKTCPNFEGDILREYLRTVDRKWIEPYLYVEPVPSLP
jgi:hypothetical protein